MNMRVVGVVVDGANPLMLGKAQRGAYRLLYVTHNLGAGILAGPEGNKSSGRSYPTPPAGWRLDKHNVLRSIFWRMAVAVGDSHQTHALVTSLRAGDVSHQPAKIALGSRLHGDVFCDHRRGPFFSR
ncbi:hypothetical protein [Tardibacter chloracetimidivorans]|uniref:hypothetical protein n=1 Tax=Tardibacter chloracetimidivorans TaxID=1921510 RepID=UPI001D057D1B|nr:hypothetical protein [Tardibacter chloracetimidivorans]